VHWLDSVSLVLLVIAVAFFVAAVTLLCDFIRSSGRDPLTRYAPDARSAQARRWAGVYVRRPETKDDSPVSLDRHPA
jgi:hypothetical protein